MSNTPETDAKIEKYDGIWPACSIILCRKLERERDATTNQLFGIADLFDYDDTIGGESLVDYMRRMVGKLRNENAALRDALRVRVMQHEHSRPCPDCGYIAWHDSKCRHYETEKKITHPE